MSKALVRKLVDGAWRWVQEEDAADGGSQPLVKVVRVPFAFDTPGILTGLPLYTFAVGEVLVTDTHAQRYVAFDGTTPNGHVLIDGEAVGTDDYINMDLTTVDDFYDDSQGLENMKLASTGGIAEQIYCVAPADLILVVDDGAGGDPNDPTPMTQGSGEVVLFIATVAP